MATGGLDVGASTNQRISGLDVVGTDHPMEGGGPIYGGGVHVRTLLQQPPHRLAVAGASSPNERRIVSGARHGGDRRHKRHRQQAPRIRTLSTATNSLLAYANFRP